MAAFTHKAVLCPSLVLLLLSLPPENRGEKDPCQFDFFKCFNWNYSRSSKALTVCFSLFPLKMKIPCQSNKDSHLILRVGPQLVKKKKKTPPKGKWNKGSRGWFVGCWGFFSFFLLCGSVTPKSFFGTQIKNLFPKPICVEDDYELKFGQQN